METEKRRSQRKALEGLVRFDGDNFSIYSKLADLSEHGAFVATHYLLDPGTDIEIHLYGVVGKESVLPARVVHSSTAKELNGSKTLGLGVEFDSRLELNA